jgi:hypothetical protein
LAAKQSWAHGSSPEGSLLASDIYTDREWLNLLHFSDGKSVINRDSTFFLSKTGYIDAKAEYVATVKALFDRDSVGNSSVRCRYPARVKFIEDKLNLKKFDIPEQKCKEYEEYLQKVPIERVFLVFATENNSNPESIMGHLFLKLSGLDSKNVQREHAFSFFTILSDEGNNLKNYINATFGGANGMYILSPYYTKKEDYVYGQGRSLWEFEVKLGTEEKEKLERHLWELKEQPINYIFTTHNCSSALINTLKVANDRLGADTTKFFITPIEYLQELSDKQMIANIYVTPSEVDKKIMTRHGLYDIIDTPKSTKISISHENFGDNYLNFSIAPVYKEIKDVSNSNFMEYESKIFSVNLKYNVNSEQIFVNNIDIFKTKSIVDYSLTDSFSKHFRISLGGKLFENRTNLMPNMEIGRGMGMYGEFFSIYGMGILGYRYDEYGNFYFAPSIGVIVRPSEMTKFVSFYEYYFNAKGNNRGYRSRYNAYFGYAINKSNSLYIEYDRYSKSTNANSISFGVSTYF